MTVLEGKCPGCGWWVRLDSGKLPEHMRSTGGILYRCWGTCRWGGHRPPETRAAQLELKGLDSEPVAVIHDGEGMEAMS